MSASDKLSAFALVVSLVSFWLSYRTMRLGNRLSAAEKRTQTQSILVGALLEAQELRQLVRLAVNYKGSDVTFPNGLPNVETQLSEMTSNLQLHLSQIRVSVSDDPVQAERVRAYALEVEASLKRLAPMIREMPVTPAKDEI